MQISKHCTPSLFLSLSLEQNTNYDNIAMAASTQSAIVFFNSLYIRSNTILQQPMYPLYNNDEKKQQNFYIFLFSLRQ